jgi:hypothetical protein
MWGGEGEGGREAGTRVECAEGEGGGEPGRGREGGGEGGEGE